MKNILFTSLQIYKKKHILFVNNINILFYLVVWDDIFDCEFVIYIFLSNETITKSSP